MGWLNIVPSFRNVVRDFRKQPTFHFPEPSQTLILAEFNDYCCVQSFTVSINYISSNFHPSYIQHPSAFTMAAAEDDAIIDEILSTCDVSTGPGVRSDDCSICRDRIESNKPTITHKACKTTWCSACISGWLKTLDYDERVLCPICRVKMKIVEEDYDDPVLASSLLHRRLARPAAHEVRVFKDHISMEYGALEYNDAYKDDSAEGRFIRAFARESLEIEALCNRQLLTLKTAEEIRESIRLPRIEDETHMLISETLGARTYRQYRIKPLPDVELCLAQMPPVMAAESITEVRAVLGDATFNKIFSRTAERSFGRLIEWPLDYLDFHLIDDPSHMNFAYFQYLQSRGDTTWMVLPCDVIETPFVPLDDEKFLSRGLAFIFPSIWQPPANVEATTRNSQLMRGLQLEVAERCFLSREIREEKRAYDRRDLTPLETLWVIKEVVTRVWGQLVWPLFDSIPTVEEQERPGSAEDLSTQLMEVDNLLLKFRIAWRMYFSNYWHQIMEDEAHDDRCRRTEQRQSYSSSVTQTLQKLLIDGTVLEKQPLSDYIKKIAMHGVARIITEEAITLAKHHVAFGWTPAIELRDELEGDHVHD